MGGSLREHGHRKKVIVLTNDGIHVAKGNRSDLLWLIPLKYGRGFEINLTRRKSSRTKFKNIPWVLPVTSRTTIVTDFGYEHSVDSLSIEMTRAAKLT